MSCYKRRVDGTSGVTYRAFRPSDAPAVLALELAAETVEPADYYIDLVEVQQRLENPGLRLADGSVAALVGERIVAGGGLIVNTPAEKWVALLHAQVLPESRHRGIGRAVFDRLLDKARAIHAAEYPDLAGEVRVWLLEGRNSADRFAAAAGFTPRRYFFDMRADLAAPPGPPHPLPEGVEIVAWTPADDEGTRLAYNDSFADHWGSSPAGVKRWRNLFAESSLFRPECSRLARKDGRVVGFVLVDEFPSETLAHGYRSGYIDRVGTVRDARGRGVATALMSHSLHALHDSGCHIAELTVDAESPTGAGRLYERLGFAVRRQNEVRGLEIATVG